ncbi:hypothetical protein DS893_17155 [Vibrionales bacterium C3R12]|uniref:hypothetical protein n=1 Tax=Vibrio cortegadensis TaxID=1328770 RepID=UPI000DE9FCDF|nr:hypothetical protein DS893_17155 [Vibrionales bacterium C3R12]
MLLNDIVQIIEMTDTDHLSQAIDTFNEQGRIHSDHLPFLNVVYDKAGNLLLDKLNSIGFKGAPQYAKDLNGDYVIFDANKFTSEEALSRHK